VSKILKNFRLSEDTVKELEELAGILGITETEVVSRAIHFLYLQTKGQESTSFSGSLVPFSEYQKAQEQLKQALYKLGELQGKLEEKEKVISAKEELIEELRNQLKELKTKPAKKWWEFWK